MDLDAILYRTRRIDAIVRRELTRLRTELPDKEVWAVGYSREESDFTAGQSNLVYATTAETLRTLPYSAMLETVDWLTMTGHHDLPALHFFRANSHFDHYWIIEDDVRYTGSWSDFFQDVGRSTADLLVTTLLPKTQNSDWYWWPGLHRESGMAIAEQHLHRCFTPLARISHRLMRALDAGYQAGWNGHFEGLWPTICSAEGFTMEDIGGSGPYTPEERKGRYYSNNLRQWNLFPGTFVFRPSFHDRDIMQHGTSLTGQPTLWHPVKW